MEALPSLGKRKQVAEQCLDRARILRYRYPNAMATRVGAKKEASLVVHASCLKSVCATGGGRLLQCDTYSTSHFYHVRST